MLECGPDGKLTTVSVERLEEMVQKEQEGWLVAGGGRQSRSTDPNKLNKSIKVRVRYPDGSW